MTREESLQPGIESPSSDEGGQMQSHWFVVAVFGIFPPGHVAEYFGFCPAKSVPSAHLQLQS
jgi:hypothetical protein